MDSQISDQLQNTIATLSEAIRQFEDQEPSSHQISEEERRRQQQATLDRIAQQLSEF